MWILREWINSPLDGWTSDFSRWDTKEEAEEQGKLLVRLKLIDEYEVYESGE